jgi:hypothetical protein
MFPTLDEADGVDPFDVDILDAWACGPVPSSGGRYAAQFILAVWSGRVGRVGSRPTRDSEGSWIFNVETAWKCGPFDVVDALGTWDAQHRSAFLEWAANPWWP